MKLISEKTMSGLGVLLPLPARWTAPVPTYPSSLLPARFPLPPLLPSHRPAISLPTVGIFGTFAALSGRPSLPSSSLRPRLRLRPPAPAIHSFGLRRRRRRRRPPLFKRTQT